MDLVFPEAGEVGIQDLKRYLIQVSFCPVLFTVSLNTSHFSYNCEYKIFSFFAMRCCFQYAVRHFFPQRIFCLSVHDVNVTDGVVLKGNFNVNELHENKKIPNVAGFLHLQ